MKKPLSIIFLLIILVIFLHPWTAAGDQQCGRILVVGDSLAQSRFATGINRGYAFLVADELGASLATINGKYVEQARQKVTDYVAYDPCLVVVELGLNDVRIYSQEQGIPAAAWGLEYGALLDELGELYPEAQLIACTMFHSVKDERPDYRDYLAFNEQIRLQSVQRNISICELWNNTYGHEEYLAQDTMITFVPPFVGDNWHPNNLGHQAIAAEILRVIGREYYVPLLVNQEIDR